MTQSTHYPGVITGQSINTKSLMRVSTDKNKDKIRGMFDSIAHSYDRLNHALSLGIDRRWRKAVTRIAAQRKAAEILDIATGTGDMAIELSRLKSTVRVVGGDFSPNMLAVARGKAARMECGSKITFVEEDALNLSQDDESFDMTVVAFGARNFADLGRGLEQMGRVTKKGGAVVVLELTIPRNIFVKAAYRLYFHGILPIVGRITSKDKNAYSYLPLSVEQFPQREEFTKIMEQAGLRNCKHKSLTLGIATLYSAEK